MQHSLHNICKRTTIAFADVNDTVMLLYANTIGWVVVSNSGAAVS